MKGLLEKLYKENNLSRKELIKLLNNMNTTLEKTLFDYARQTKESVYGKSTYARGLIEFSNYCKQNCLYCGLRKDNKNIQRYRLSTDEILECCREGYTLGYKTFVLQSGEDPYYNDQVICRILEKIRHEFPDVAITLSIGEREKESYKKYFTAGADRFLLRHETANKSIYEKLHPNMSFENRRQCLNDLKEIGYQVGAGFMVGLPGQSNEALAEDLLFLKKLQPHMVGIGPFIPHSETPIGGEKGGSVEQTLIMVALTRLFLPRVLLPATTALGTLDATGREKALGAGANVVMPNVSPLEVREKYELYQDKICTTDRASHCRKCIENRIIQSGFDLDLSRGDHIELGVQ